MRILVTGGAGFIGSHLCDRLLEAGHAVTALDDLSTGAAGNVASARDRGEFRLHLGDAADRDTAFPLVAAADLVVHLAAEVGVRRVLERPVASIANNLGPLETVLAAAAARGVPVLYASSSEVYGRSASLPHREEAELVLGSPRVARWSYACAKAMGEWMCFARHRESGLPVTVVRLFNTVGPRQSDRYGMVLPTFVRQGLSGLPLTVHGDGSQTRCFAAVDEVSRALAALATDGFRGGRILNVGSDREIAIGELARRVAAATGGRSPVVSVDPVELYGPDFEDLPRRVPALDALRAAVGFAPSRDIDDIFRETVAAERRAAERTAES
ncbi:MAG: NAD-dependent epimerase/dehydratase family protein [Planctomycetota bacterium]